ncbi:hypothetical protein, partial [Variovorax sp. OV084]|uniref:hypothetical protein n=1 Tax=Variovorax sp. OV084 TaxID=1882777 RepID=UPI001C431482
MQALQGHGPHFIEQDLQGACGSRRFDLPGFSETLISRKMAPARRGAHEEESIFRRANGHDPA